MSRAIVELTGAARVNLPAGALPSSEIPFVIDEFIQIPWNLTRSETGLYSDDRWMKSSFSNGNNIRILAKGN